MTLQLARHRPALAAALTLALGASGGAAQAGPDAALAPPAVGQMAPDFSLRGATRYGLLALPVKLSDFRGKTVVIAFFYQARTKG
jgi:hypothetical protein